MLYDKHRSIYKALNHPLTRPPLAVAATIMKSVICREPCLVWYKEKPDRSPSSGWISSRAADHAASDRIFPRHEHRLFPSFVPPAPG